MKFKSFSFGLGIGIIFSSVIFLVVYNNQGKQKDNITVAEYKAELSEDEIIEKAKELGMTFYIDLPERGTDYFENGVEDTTDAIINTEETTINLIDNKGSKINEEVNSVEVNSIEETTVINNNITTETESVSTNNDIETEETTEVITASIRINSGTNATTVSRLLEQAGIIENRKDYLNYLIKNSKSTKIITGTYSLASNMSYEEITKIITTRRNKK